MRLLARNKLKASEKKRSLNNLWYYPGIAAWRRSRYMDNLRAGRPEVRIPERLFSLKNRTNRLWNPHSLPFNGYRGLFTGAKRTWHEADHSPVSSGEVKNKWACASAPPTYLHGVDRANFTFTYTIPSLAWTNWPKKNYENIVRTVKFQGRVLIQGSPEWEAGLLNTRPKHSVLIS